MSRSCRTRIRVIIMRIVLAELKWSISLAIWVVHWRVPIDFGSCIQSSVTIISWDVVTEILIVRRVDLRRLETIIWALTRHLQTVLPPASKSSLIGVPDATTRSHLIFSATSQMWAAILSLLSQEFCSLNLLFLFGSPIVDILLCSLVSWIGRIPCVVDGRHWSSLVVAWPRFRSVAQSSIIHGC